MEMNNVETPFLDTEMQPQGFTRRSLLVAASIVPFATHTDVLAGDFWSRPRALWLQRTTRHGVEEHRGIYFADGKLIWPEYARLCTILRDVKADQAVQMSPVLIDILCGIQGVAAAHGHNVPLMTTSGYRNPKTNASIEGAARNSLHMQGRAWDGRLPGYSAKVLADVAVYLRGGGVGLYVDRNFCHIDDGRLRSWSGR
jgi:uncharacterized protein YcbK (DUF882 family)